MFCNAVNRDQLVRLFYQLNHQLISLPDGLILCIPCIEFITHQLSYKSSSNFDAISIRLYLGSYLTNPFL